MKLIGFITKNTLWFIGIMFMISQFLTADENILSKKEVTLPPVNNSKRVYRSLLLKNHLKVVLISDEKVNKSAASMDVHVGSMEDPIEYQGLFHFLEHMLFLGTKKYPVVGEYSKYLKEHNGYSNAFTSQERTNYHFDVSHDALEGALDRFAQFFISPLFNESETDKEKNNVNSEHQKNIPSDMWKILQVMRSNFKKDHPLNHFSTGTVETLKNCTREILIQMYEKFYSANEMSLSILSNRSLDELERMCVSYFSEIPNRNIQAPAYSSDFLDKSFSAKFIQIVPKSDIRSLNIIFELPILDYKNSKVARVISSILGHEGKGTITAYLKNKNYITSLSTGDDVDGSIYRLDFTINLTPTGREHYLDVLDTIFSYIKLMQNTPFPAYYYNELKDICLIDYKNQEEEQGTSYVISLSSHITDYGLEDALTKSLFFEDLTDTTKENYFKILSKLNPKNAIFALVSRDVKTDKEEPYYKTLYSVTDEPQIGSLLTNAKENNTSLNLPIPNPYISKNQEIIAPRPYLLMSNNSCEIWYAQDNTFHLPKASITLQFLTPLVKETVQNAILLSLFRDCFSKELNEETYPMIISGLSYQFSINQKGIVLAFNGFSDQVLPLVKYIGSRLKTFTIQEDTFNTVKEKMVQNLKNLAYEPAYRQAISLFQNFNSELFFDTDEKLQALDTIQYKDLLNFSQKSIFKVGYIQGSVYGNLRPQEVQASLEELVKTLNFKPLAKNLFPIKKVAQLTPTNASILLSKKLITNNSAIYQSFSFGLENPKKRGAALVLARVLEAPYYEKMRTDEHLGYIVWSTMDQQEKNIYQTFIIQSGEYSADYLKERSNLFIQSFKRTLEALTPEDIEVYKTAVINKKLEKPKTISEVNSKFFYQAFEKERDFDHVASDIKAVQTLVKEDIINLYEEIIDPNKCKETDVLCYGVQHEQKVENTSKEQLKKLKAKTKYAR